MIDAKIIIFFEFRPHIQPSSQKFLPIASPLFYLNIKNKPSPHWRSTIVVVGRGNKTVPLQSHTLNSPMGEHI